MPKLRDIFDGTIRDVPQVIYDSWVVQTTRFAPVSDDTAAPATAEQAAPSSASDLVGTGQAPEPVAQHVVDSAPNSDATADPALADDAPANPET